MRVVERMVTMAIIMVMGSVSMVEVMEVMMAAAMEATLVAVMKAWWR